MQKGAALRNRSAAHVTSSDVRDVTAARAVPIAVAADALSLLLLQNETR
jgi:hypothetical protein